MEATCVVEDPIDITVNNFDTALPAVLDTIQKSDFIAFDLEFSGTDYKPYFRCVYSDTVYLFWIDDCLVRNSICKVSCGVGVFDLNHD